MTLLFHRAENCNAPNDTGVYEYVNGELYFYNTVLHARHFIEHAIVQNQQIIDYLLRRTLNPYAKPFQPSTINESPEFDNNINKHCDKEHLSDDNMTNNEKSINTTNAKDNLW